MTEETIWERSYIDILLRRIKTSLYPGRPQHPGSIHAGTFWNNEPLEVIDTITAVTSYLVP